MPRCAAIDSRSAVEYLRRPDATGAGYPFARTSSRGDGESWKSSGSQEKKKGREPAHAAAQAKYAGGRIPKPIKRLLKNSWPLLPNMKRGRWGKLFKKLCSNALAKSTWGKYAAAVNSFRKFCSEQAEPFRLPVSPEVSNSWIVWATGEGNLGANTMKAYLAALHSLGRLFDAKMGGQGAEKLLLAGASNLARHSKPASAKRAPFTFKVLQRLCAELRAKRWKISSKLAIKAFCCTGYFGSFRAGELLAKDSWSFDKFSDLTWADIALTSDPLGGSRSATLHIKEPKTRLEGGEFVELFRFEDPELCPVAALDRLAAAQKAKGKWDPAAPVFRFGSGKNLTVSGATRLIKILLKKTEFSQQNLTASSLRSGIPTDMKSRPDLFGDTQIKSWGRWRSGAYQWYMKRDAARKRDIYRRLSCMLCKWI